MATSLQIRLVHLIRASLYHIGALNLYHRLRNRRTLTVLMFHRVLPPDSAAYRRAEREFTFSVEGFAACLDFVRRHYHAVGLERLIEARTGGRPLPARAALITFDDGWHDTVEYAYPQLVKRGLPAVLFLSTEVLEATHARWWADALVELAVDAQRTDELARELGLPAAGLGNMPALMAALAALPLARRNELLARRVDGIGLPRQMVTREDLAATDSRFFAIAAHGHTHAPLTAVADLGAELARSRALVAELHGYANVMSLPHGAGNAATLEAARRAGFEWIFSSAPDLNSPDALRAGRVLGRLHVPENQWTCANGRISAARLATFLFLRRIAS